MSCGAHVPAGPNVHEVKVHGHALHPPGRDGQRQAPCRRDRAGAVDATHRRRRGCRREGDALRSDAAVRVNCGLRGSGGYGRSPRKSARISGRDARSRECELALRGQGRPSDFAHTNRASFVGQVGSAPTSLAIQVAAQLRAALMVASIRRDVPALLVGCSGVLCLKHRGDLTA